MTGLLAVVWKALSRRWTRHLLTVATTALGAGTLVSVVTISATSAQDVETTLDELRSDAVRVTMPHAAWSVSEGALLDRAKRSGIVAQGGTYVDSRSGTFAITVRPRLTAADVRVDSVVATADGLRARGARLVQGALPRDSEPAADNVLLGTAIAKELSVSTEPGSNTLHVNGATMWIRGIVEDASDGSGLSAAVVFTPDSAMRLGILPEQRAMTLTAVPGAATELARIAPVALFPSAATDVAVGTEPSPERLRAKLLAGSRSLVLTVAGVSVLAAVLGIVTTMQIAVRERRQEIGIGRAMGESRRAVSIRFLSECITLGLVGGCAGWAVGMLVAAATAQAQQWLFVVPPWTLGIMPASGVIGALGGSLPAWSASRVAPATLLRAE